MNRHVRNILYRSFDTALSDEEQHRLDAALTRSAALREEREQLVRMRRAISGGAVRTFAPGFVPRLMQRITASETPAPELFFEALFSTFRRVAMVAVIVALCIMTYNMVRDDAFSLTSTFGLTEPTLEEMLDTTVALEAEGIP